YLASNAEVEQWLPVPEALRDWVRQERDACARGVPQTMFDRVNSVIWVRPDAAHDTDETAPAGTVGRRFVVAVNARYARAQLRLRVVNRENTVVPAHI